MFLKSITLISLFLFGNIALEPLKHCVDPEIGYLENLYSEHEAFNRRYEEAHFASFKNVILNKNDSVYDESLTDNTQCSNNARNITRTNHLSSCPWTYDIKFRKDRFPNYLNDVRCTCKSCIGSSSKLSYKPQFLPTKQVKCEPLMKQVPVLIRGECGLDGYYQWHQDYEYVNVACICAFQNKLYPYKN